MNAQPYKVNPESETVRLVREAASSGAPVRVDTGEAVYHLNADEESPDRLYLPTPEEAAASVAAIKQVAGAWKELVDADELKAYIRERRKTANPPSLE